MQGDIHRAKTTHRKTADAAIRCFRNNTILLINVLDQVDGNVRLDELPVIEAVAPLACCSWTSIAIRQYQDEFRYLAESNQGISRLIGLAAGKPVALSTRCPVQKIEGGIAFCPS